MGRSWELMAQLRASAQLVAWQLGSHYVMETGSRHQTGPALMWLLTLSLCFNFIDLIPHVMMPMHNANYLLATIKV